jgi:hypothetical protein
MEEYARDVGAKTLLHGCKVPPRTHPVQSARARSRPRLSLLLAGNVCTSSQIAQTSRKQGVAGWER